MALSDLSQGYKESAQALSTRLRELRALLNQTSDPDEIWHIKRRIGELTPILTEMYKLAELTERYYEKGYTPPKEYCFTILTNSEKTAKKGKDKFTKNGLVHPYPERKNLYK